MLQEANDRVPRAAGAMRRTLQQDDRVVGALAGLAKIGDQTRFADARLSHQGDDLAYAGTGLFKARLKQVKMIRASNEGRQPRNMMRIEATAHRPGPQHARNPRRSILAFQLVLADILQIKQSAK